MIRRSSFLVAATLCALVAGAVSLRADHAWGSYHWAQQSTPFTLQVGNNLSGGWQTAFYTALSDWSQSTVLDVNGVVGGTNPKNCRPTSGRIEVCNSKYGQNGWLGIAQIWASGSHISQAITKLNDTYFNMPRYNTSAWRNMVMCQEIGHDFGLDHQDENFTNANLGTCMDYTNDPSTNQHPNQHDYGQLVDIYSHSDSFTTVGQVTNGAPGLGAVAQLERDQFGQLIRSTNGGRTQLFVLELGAGQRVFTHVIWAE